MTFALEILPQLLATGVMIGAIYALLALCFYVVHAGTSVINFAQGDFVVIGLVFMWTCFVGWGLPLYLAIPLTILATGFVVAALERVAIAPVGNHDPIIALLVTLAIGILIRSVVQVLWGAQPRAVPHYSGDTPILLGGASILPQAIWIVGGAIVILALLYFFFTHTLFGLAMRGAASDREGAQVIGVNGRLISFYAFGMSALISGATGAIIAPVVNADPFIGLDFSLKGFAGAVLGGIDKPHSAVLGGLFIGVLETLIAGLVSSEYRNIFVFGILMLVLVVRPNGLLGSRT